MKRRFACVGPAVVGLAASLAAGCTNVTIYEGDGSIRTEQGVGQVDVQADPQGQPQVIEVETFGLGLFNGEMTLGYRSSRLAILPLEDCRIVVWVDETTSTDAVRELVDQMGDDACIVGTD